MCLHYINFELWSRFVSYQTLQFCVPYTVWFNSIWFARHSSSHPIANNNIFGSVDFYLQQYYLFLVKEHTNRQMLFTIFICSVGCLLHSLFSLLN